MVKISHKLMKTRILNFLNSVQDKQEINLKITKEEEDDNDDDEKINQIDRIIDFIFYYETSLRNNNQL